MNKVWYVRRGSEVFGPAETQRVQEMVRSGRLAASDEAAATWDGPFAPISTIAELSPVRPFSDIDRPVPAQAPPSRAAAPEPPVAPVAPPEPGRLPEDVRDKYVAALSRKGESWVWGLAFLAMLVLTSVVSAAAGFEWKWAPLVLLVVSLGLAGYAVEFYKSARARTLAGHSDKMLEVMYAEFQRARMTSRIVQGVGLVVALGIALWWLFDTPGGERFRLNLTSDASCALGDVFHRPEVFLANGQFDAGYVVQTTIENTGRQGRILVEASLTTSEGTLTRRQWETFGPGERREVRVNFPEPTVAASNPSSYLSCSPAR